MIQSIVLFLYQLAMYVGHLAAAPTDVEYARGHPMWLCNWLPRELLAQWRSRRQAGIARTPQAYWTSKEARAARLAEVVGDGFVDAPEEAVNE